MNIENDEVLRRKTLALAAIKKTFGTEEGEYGANLFVSHHLDEIDEEYWISHLGTDTPDGMKILGLLTLRWPSDDEEEGLEVSDISMES